MKRPDCSRILAILALGSIAIAGCKKKQDEEADAKPPGGDPTSKAAGAPMMTPGGSPRSVGDPESSDPDSGAGNDPVTAIARRTPAGVGDGNQPSEALAGDGGKTSVIRNPDENPVRGPKGQKLLDPNISPLNSEGRPSTEALLATLPESPHSAVLLEGIALSDQMLAALEGAKDAPGAIAALKALDSEFQAVGNKMSELGDPDEETTELLSAVLRSKEEFRPRMQAAIKNLIKLDPSLSPQEAGKKASLESAQLYRAATALVSHYERGWPTVKP